MANIYVDSNATAGSATGADWANAYLTLAAAAAVDNAGDIIWVAHNHSESTAGLVSLVWAGTQASPTRVICANSGSGEPPTTLATTAQVATTGANNLNLVQSTGASVYYYGVNFSAGDSTNVANISLNQFANSIFVAEACTFILGNTNSSSKIDFSNPDTSFTTSINCDFQFGSTSQGCDAAGHVLVIGGSIVSGTVPSSFISICNDGTEIEIEGFDFSNAASSMDILNTGSTLQNVVLTTRNCKLPSSWSGSILASAVLDVGTKGLLHNCSASDVNYALEIDDVFGTIVHETTLVKSGGASDGTTSISWEMTTNADAEWSHQTLDSPEIVRWNETVGSSVTLTVDILHDSATNLQDDEIWLEVQYLGTSGFPLSLFVDDAAATYTTTAADQTTSAATWTTTGMSNPNEQKLAVTFTPQEIGYFIAKVKMAKASYTVYVDPVLQVS